MAIKRDLLKDKLLDSKSYNTIFINIEDEERVRKEQMDILVELLCNERNKGSQTEVFNFMKKEPKTVDLLVKAIQESTVVEDRKKLVMASWEAGVDCDRYLSVFTDVAINDTLLISIEALTTIEHMTGKSDPKTIEASINKASAAYTKETDSTKKQLIADLIEVLRKWQ